MRMRLMQGSMAALLLASTLWGGGATAHAESIGVEVKLTGGQFEVSRKGMDLSNDYAIWASTEDKDQVILLYSLSNERTETIAKSSSSKSTPKVDTRYAVWMDFQRSGGDIYLYDIKSGGDAVRITGSETKLVEGELDVQGNYVVWTDIRDGKSNIYAYDIKNDETIQVTTSGKASKPSVSGNYVVWQDERTRNDIDIYYYDLSKGKEYQATNDSDRQENPQIDGDLIVYEDYSDSVSQIYTYDIAAGRSRAVTSSDDGDKTNPTIAGDTVVYTEGKTLMKVDLSRKREVELDSIYHRIRHSSSDRYVLYAKDNGEEIGLYLYDLKEDESTGLGSTSGTPTEPRSSNKYVAYLNEGRNDDSVVLYSVEDKSSKVVSSTKDDPTHPVVSDSYVVWYDNKEDLLISYNIKSGKRTAITDDDMNPLEDAFEIYGNKLVWVNQDRRGYQLILTDLSTLKEESLKKLGSEPVGIDIYGTRVIWAEQDGRDYSITVYDFEEKDTFNVHDRARDVDPPSIGEDYAVWSELVNGQWEVYYYDFKYRNISTLYNKTQQGDQRFAQIYGNILIYGDNQFSRQSDEYKYSVYDIDNRRDLRYYPGQEGVPEQVSIGGNRIVWVDNESGDTILYMMPISEPLEEPGDGGGGDDDDLGKVYRLDKALFDGTLDRLVEKYSTTEIYFAFRNGTDEKLLSLREALRDFDGFVDLVSSYGFSKTFVFVELK